jgi:N-acetylglutamate synthase-like GNAT family acetyltransferase
MKDFILVQHASGAPGLRFFGLGPNFMPLRGIKKLQSLLDENTSWANQRSTNNIKKMLSSSEVVVSVWLDKRIIGFGRATSDKVYRAVLWDIVVEKNYQEIGIGKNIIKSLLSNKLISKVEKIYIMTTRFEKFYSKMNFKLEKNQKLMFLEN